MAEAIVKLRAIYLSGDLDQYWAFHVQQEQNRLYLAGKWSVVESSHTQKEKEKTGSGRQLGIWLPTVDTFRTFAA